MRIFLHIASLFYLGLTRLRLLCYQLHFLKKHVFDIPIVSVRNITVGGTGKTPMIIYLSQLLTKQNIKHVIVSRGYKKMARGTLVVQDYDKKYINNPTIAGDEPVMLTYKLDNIPIIVDSNKSRGIALAIRRFCPKVVLLDDGFQSVYIDKKRDFLLIDNSIPITQYQLMPKGRLREPLLALERSDCVVFLNKGRENIVIKKTIIPILYKHSIPYIDASFKSKTYQHIYKTQSLEQCDIKKVFGLSCVSISGIGNAQSFIDEANRLCNVLKNYSFPDHYSYSKNEDHFDDIVCKQERRGGINTAFGIITTLKDYVKIVQLPCVQLKKYSLYVIDINLVTNDENKLLELILREG